jgi:protein SCO1/2
MYLVRRNLVFQAVCCASIFLTASASRAQVAIPDVTLVDQNGQNFHFYPGMLPGHVFAINTIFTTCSTICPLIGARISGLEKRLGPTSGKFQIISISVDPLVDTPERLREWAKQFNAGPDWTLLTGSLQDVDRVLKAFGMSSSTKESHSFSMLVGGESGWTNTTALLPERDLAGLVQSKIKGLR